MRRPALIFGVAAVTVLTAGILVLSLWPEETDEPAEPSPSPSSEVVTLISESQDNVASVYFSPRGGASYTIRRDPETGDCVLDAPDAVFPGRGSALRSIHNYATSLTYLTRVTEEATDEQLALFGLNKPVMTWRVNRGDGTSADLMIGAEQAVGSGGRYARKQNSREVFLLTGLQSSFLTMTLEDLYDLTFYPYGPTTDEEYTWLAIENVVIEKKNGEVIELRRRSAGELEETLEETGLNLSNFQLTRPLTAEGDDYMIESIVMAPITRIAPESVETLLPADLSLYGLDRPDKLTVTEEEGWSGTLLIGRYDAERGGRYVMIEGHDAVLFDPAGDYSFLSADPAELRTGQLWLYDIKLVSSLTYELDGVTRELIYEHSYGEDEKHTVRGWFDGLEISEDNARRLYVCILRLTQDGGTAADIPSAAPAYRFTIHFLDGGSETMELYRLTDSQYLIVLNGENTGFYITRMRLQQYIFSRIEMLDRGEEIPRL